jgi:hypothetical protein
MQLIRAYWLILDLTDSPVAVGALALVQTLPVTAAALVGGSIADRVDLRRMVIACEAVLLTQAALLCVLALTGLVAAGSCTCSARVRHRRRTRRASTPHARLPDRRPDDLTNAVGSARASARPRASSAPRSAASSSRRSARASRSA